MSGNERAVDPWRNSALAVAPRRPPLNPTSQDGAFVLEALDAAAGGTARPPAVLILGVTPETVQLAWPPGTSLVAVDSSPGMIAAHWRPHPSCPSHVVCAPWQDMPLEAGSVDLAAGDGSLNALPSVDVYAAVLRDVARVLRPGGMLALRCFVKQDLAERPADVVRAAFRGEFPTTAAFRMRFLMSLAGRDRSVRLADAPPAFDALVADRDRIVEATGWPRAHIDLVDVDIGRAIALTFPTEAEFKRALEPDFDLVATRRGAYILSDFCPTLVLRRR